MPLTMFRLLWLQLERRLPNLERIAQPGPSHVPRVSIGRMDYAIKVSQSHIQGIGAGG
jgi:hypothetical protein